MEDETQKRQKSQNLADAKNQPGWKLQLLLFPFVAAAVAINLFLLFLLLQWVGLKALAPLDALLWAIPLALPANWLTARWVTRLINIAEGNHPG